MVFSKFSLFFHSSSPLPWNRGEPNPTVTKLPPGTMYPGGIEPDCHEIAPRYMTLKKVPPKSVLRFARALFRPRFEWSAPLYIA